MGSLNGGRAVVLRDAFTGTFAAAGRAACPLDEHAAAGGRRRYNCLRQFKANYRLLKVVELLHQTRFSRGYQTQIAKALGVHRSTMCRDFRRLYRRDLFGLESDKVARGMAVVAKHARDDAMAAAATLPDDEPVPMADGRRSILPASASAMTF